MAQGNELFHPLAVVVDITSLSI